MNIEQKVIKVLSEKLSIDEEWIQPDALLREDLGLDSLAAVEMLFDLESEYDIEILDEEVQTFKRPRDIIEYLKNRFRN